MNICLPTLIYIIFSLTQVVIDTYLGKYNTSFLKLLVMIIISFLLNTLCEHDLGIISWLIIFIPFIFMTFMVSLLLYIFGLDASSGQVDIHNESTINAPTGTSSPQYESFFSIM